MRSTRRMAVALLVGSAVAAAACEGGDEVAVSGKEPVSEATSPRSADAIPRAVLLSGGSGFIQAVGAGDFQVTASVAAGRARQLFPTYESPFAVAAPDGTVLYNAVGGDGRPEIRLADLAGDSDQLLVADAYSIAVDGSGRLAYVDSTRRDPVREGGIVTVRAADGGAPVGWSDGPGRYVVLAWANDTLLVRRARVGDEGGDLIAFDAPGRMRVIGERTALLALNDDGRVAFVGVMSGDGSSYEMRLVDVASGATLATLDSIAGGPAKPIVSAQWQGDAIVASGAIERGTVSVILVLTAREVASQWKIGVERVAELPADVLVPDEVWLSSDGETAFGIALPPQRSDASGAPIPSPLRLVHCSLSDGACSVRDLGEMTDTQVGRVRNPTRPVPSSKVFSEALSASNSSL